MWNKVLGTALVVGAIFGLIFGVKFANVYLAANNLESVMQDCIAHFQAYHEDGCRADFKRVIDQEGLSLDPASIVISAKVQDPNSFVEANIDETIDFFGVWEYNYTTTLRADGAPPSK